MDELEITAECQRIPDAFIGINKSAKIDPWNESGLSPTLLRRARQVRITLQCFAAYHHILSEHLARVLGVLRYEQVRAFARVFIALRFMWPWAQKGFMWPWAQKGAFLTFKMSLGACCVTNVMA